MLTNVKLGKNMRSVSIVGIGATPFFNGVENPTYKGLTNGELFGYAALDAMKDAGLKRKAPAQVTVAQVIKANSLFDMAMENGTFQHMHQSAVTQVVSNCERRKIGANGGLGYQSTLDGADIALLDSMILAHWICSETKAEKKTQKVYI